MADRDGRTDDELQALLSRFDETWREAEHARSYVQRSLARRTSWPDDVIRNREAANDPPDNDQSALTDP
jgi:hypothetical protein